MRNDIDIVVPWVDGSDKSWQASYIKHKPKKEDQHSHFERFRDWDLMKYWFRGIEENMPWIRKIHFITCGHIPSWLNIEHEKINIVKHEDYIPSEYLPVFSSHVIEIYINKIKDLAEKFIYFNDDIFILQKIDSNYFFNKDLPCDTFSFNALNCENISHIIMNDIRQINKEFDKKEVIKNNLFKIFSPKYIDKSLRSLLLLPWPRITGFFDHHLPQAYLKSTFNDVWSKNADELKITAKNKFRSNEDVNQYLFRYWQLCTGQFHPFALYKYAIFTSVSDSNVDIISNNIKNKSRKIIVINDGNICDFAKAQEKICGAFEVIFPRASSFEL
ncbi:Stealth CR1 domain-containing protein [Citrobacter sedlakii]|uniref:Stealth CR1 domain-containing protein n=1 Tax=Citrobacter sedlakii TaxID=67826 RepID=UPI003336551F